ncbi:MAG: hypothetical protein AAFP19_08785 [Bacteroidota bacterium]
MTLNLSTSSEFMTNYKLVEVLSQEKPFRAVQSGDGSTLFFGIDTEDRFNAIYQTNGKGSGWKKHGISKDLSGKVKQFNVAQNQDNWTIDLLVVMRDGDKDVLYTWFDVSSDDSFWADEVKPNWTKMEDTRSDKPADGHLEIASTFLADIKGESNYLLVDVKNDNDQIDRYWVKMDDENKAKWSEKPLVGNFTTNSALTDVFGKPGNAVPGFYTLAAVNDIVDCVFQPLYDKYGEPGDTAPAMNFDLKDTGLVVNEVAMGGCSAFGKPTATDIFLAGAGKLFYLPAKDQKHDAKPTMVLESDEFTNVKELHVNSSDHQMIVWGMNHEGEVFYTTCKLDKDNPDADKLKDKANWSLPLILFSDVARMSTYLDKGTGAITIFGNHGKELHKRTQDPKQGVWRSENIELPKSDAKHQSALSYSSTLKVSDDKRKPMANAKVTLTAVSGTSVYINNVYHWLGDDPVTVETNNNGTLHIIEWTTGLQGTSIEGYLEDYDKKDSAFRFDPGSLPIVKMKSLDSVDKLNKAEIKNKDGSTKPLISDDKVTDDQKQTLIDSVKNLSAAHDSLTGKSEASSEGGQEMQMVAANAESTGDVLKYIAVAAGDALQFAGNAGKGVIKIVNGAVAGAKAAWHFVLEVGDKVYGFVLDTIKKVAHALEAIWDAVIGAIGDLIDFLKFLFNVGDIIRTKKVIEQLFKLFTAGISEDLKDFKGSFDDNFDAAKKIIEDWLSETTGQWKKDREKDHTESCWNLEPPYVDKIASFLGTIEKYEKILKPLSTTPASFVMGHMFTQLGSSSIQAPGFDEGLMKSIGDKGEWDKLFSFLKDHKEEIKSLKNKLLNMFVDDANKLGELSFKELIVQIVEDVVSGVLEIVKTAIDLLLDLLILLVEEIPKILDAPIQIPLVSSLLKDLFDVELPSVLDIMSMVCAIPATVVYKALFNEAPFKDNDFVNKLLEDGMTPAKLKELLKNSGGQQGAASFMAMAAASSDDGDKDKDKIDSFSHDLFIISYVVAGGATILNGIFELLEEATEGGSDTVMAMPKFISNWLASGVLFGDSWFDSPVGIKNKNIALFNSLLYRVDFFRDALFAVLPLYFTKGKEGDDKKKAQQALSMADGASASVFALARAVGPVWLIGEIGKKAADDGWDSTSTLNLMDGSISILSRINTLINFSAEVDEEPISKAVLIGSHSTAA